MEIKTKYNIGDKVWTMFRNKVIYFIISRIEVRVDEKETSIVYTSKDIYDEYSYLAGRDVKRNFVRSEDKLFPTKDELLKSL